MHYRPAPRDAEQYHLAANHPLHNFRPCLMHIELKPRGCRDEKWLPQTPGSALHTAHDARLNV